MSTQSSRWYKNKYVIISAAVILILVIITFVRRGNAKPDFTTATASIGTVTEEVSVTGTVSSMDNADLAFEKSGVITSIDVAVGDAVKAGDPIASLDSSADEASVESAEATLADMTRSLTPAELASDQSKVSSADSALQNAEDDALNAAEQSYTAAQGSLVNYTDDFFDNAQSANPTINIETQTPDIARSIDAERLAVSDVLKEWSADVTSATSSDATGLLSRSQGYLSTIKQFMTDLSTIVRNLNNGNSGTSASTITADVATMNNGLSGLNGAITTVTSAQSELSSAQSAYTQAEADFNLAESGNSSESIASQSAKVDEAKAVLAEDTITSPLDGIVTEVNPSLGEFIAAGDSEFAVQSNNAYKVEAYVPEADIAKVTIGDLASSTLDAYGANTDFEEKVIAIDPAETVLQGVSTYKVTLVFTNPDSRIRSGMTANIEILTHQVSNVLTVPYRAVTVTATSSTVRLVGTDGKTYTTVPVTTGLKGSDGTIEITSGLSAGDQVVTYVPGQ